MPTIGSKGSIPGEYRDTLPWPVPSKIYSIFTGQMWYNRGNIQAFNFLSKMIKKPFFFNQISSSSLIIITASFLTAFTNVAFFSNIVAIYPLNLKNIGFLVSLPWFFGGLTLLLFALICHKYTIKPVIITILIISSFSAYFMDSYNTIIDDSMIRNIVDTDVAEALDLLSIRQLLYFVFLGVLPAFLVYRVDIVYRSGWSEFAARIKLIVLTLVGMSVLVFILSDFYTSFFREHKSLRFYANPVYYLYSSGKFIHGQYQSQSASLQQIGLDAKIPASDIHRELIIFVVGETVRADRFSLNGYSRETNPLLKQETLLSLSNFWSCGTSTAVSVPCMFSIYNSSEFDIEKGRSTENVLDVLDRAGVNLLWLDNNSSSKGVADRIPYESYRSPDVNSECDIECRDIGMLRKLQSYISEHPTGDIFIVLHQMGNHGPAYYKRYPPEFERFTPACKTNQLENCSVEAINNAYDNAILYTDYFLSQVIELLKRNNESFETGMFYVSDHGESLGESGFYLHGLPNFIAPDSQRHVPAILWLGESYGDADYDLLHSKRNQRYTHDNIFHTILGFMEIESSVYDKDLDIIHADD